MSKAITIDIYTARFDAAVLPRIHLAAGDQVRVSESCDDRELDAFRRRMREAGLDWEFSRWMPRAKCNVMRLVRAK